MELMILDYICENVVVWRTENMSDRKRTELHVQQGEVSVCRVSAKSGSGREHDTPDSQDGNAGDVCDEM